VATNSEWRHTMPQGDVLSSDDCSHLFFSTGP
jgi:hypothetical protein